MHRGAIRPQSAPASFSRWSAPRGAATRFQRGDADGGAAGAPRLTRSVNWAARRGRGVGRACASGGRCALRGAGGRGGPH
eukprot:261334-Chlamydomonas_euryale.AAC.3